MEAFALEKLPLTQYLFFTGKGGVGKTSTACAVAAALADRGKRVLLVSTDPASNLQDVFALELGGKPTPIPEVSGLDAANLNPVEAAAEYRESVIAPYRGVQPLLGYCVGAKTWDRYKDIFRFSTRFALALSAVLTLHAAVRVGSDPPEGIHFRVSPARCRCRRQCRWT